MYKIIGIILLSSLIYAQEITLLHQHKEAIQNNSKKEIEATYDSEKNDWISTLNLNLSSSKASSSNRTDKASLSLSQDIYRFGGISYQISYAKANYRYKLTDLKFENIGYYKSIYNYILNIRKLKLQLRQENISSKTKSLIS